ncbi:MAG TPA: LysR substrate-binding domain-containing protein [Noviherbaspirillum sp.]|nr:LysR substrate-binding domain-containing protein [Noviherbaspirillum sp.]
MIRTVLDLRHLQTLIALRETGNISRAAGLLHVTQSALSHQIKMVEDFYGLPLFVRKSAPLAFTPAGKRLLALAEQMVPALEEADRDLRKFAQGTHGTLRIAIECHTCFEWLMPAMDAFRERWPEVELDIVAGFHVDPIGLLHQDRADMAIMFNHDDSEAVDYHPLIRFEMVALLANEHPLAAKTFLEAEDFRDQTIITYPVPEEMIDLFRQVLLPAGIRPPRRTTELTVAILQLVASRRGIAALPLWAVSNYLEKRYVTARPISRNGLQSSIWAATLPAISSHPYIEEFVSLIRELTLRTHPDIELM